MNKAEKDGRMRKHCGLLGAVEVNLPIICACLVTIKPLLAKWFPSLLGTSSPAASAQYPLYGRTARVSARQRDLGRDDLAVSASAPIDSDERLIIQMNQGKGPYRTQGDNLRQKAHVREAV